MAEMKSFVLYRDCKEHIDMLSDKDAGRLFKAIFAFVSNDEVPQLSARAAIVFSFISQQLARDARKWEDTVEKRRVAGKKGGRPRKAKKANDSFAFSEKAKKADNVNDNENDNVNDNENVNENVTMCSPAPVQPVRRAYGEYRNVMLTETERQKLAAELPETDQYYIERLSEYIAQTGKQYQSHLATIRKWAKRDREEGRRICPAASPPAGQGARAWGVTFE